MESLIDNLSNKNIFLKKFQLIFNKLKTEDNIDISIEKNENKIVYIFEKYYGVSLDNYFNDHFISPGILFEDLICYDLFNSIPEFQNNSQYVNEHPLYKYMKNICIEYLFEMTINYFSINNEDTLKSLTNDVYEKYNQDKNEFNWMSFILSSNIKSFLMKYNNFKKFIDDVDNNPFVFLK
jgi:hypothetical protein